MKRRLATLAVVSTLALGLGASPAAADSHDGGQIDHWVVMADNTTDITGFGPIVCGGHTYTVDSGTVTELWLQKGTMDANMVALTDGRAVETWTMHDVRVRNLSTGRVYRAVGSQRLEASWTTGTDLNAGPFASYSDIVDISIAGTRDGHHRVIRQVHGIIRTLSDTGTCAALQLMQ